MQSARICITGQSSSEILLELAKIKEWQGSNFTEIRVAITKDESDFNYTHDTIENLEKVVLSNDLEGYISSHFDMKKKRLKTDGNCNIQVVDDIEAIKRKIDNVRFRRNSNYTPPKNRKRKHKR